MGSHGEGKSQNWISDESVLIGMSILKLMECHFFRQVEQVAIYRDGLCRLPIPYRSWVKDDGTDSWSSVHMAEDVR